MSATSFEKLPRIPRKYMENVGIFGIVGDLKYRFEQISSSTLDGLVNKRILTAIAASRSLINRTI